MQTAIFEISFRGVCREQPKERSKRYTIIVSDFLGDDGEIPYSKLRMIAEREYSLVCDLSLDKIRIVEDCPVYVYMESRNHKELVAKFAETDLFKMCEGVITCEAFLHDMLVSAEEKEPVQ